MLLSSEEKFISRGLVQCSHSLVDCLLLTSCSPPNLTPFPSLCGKKGANTTAVTWFYQLLLLMNIKVRHFQGFDLTVPLLPIKVRRAGWCSASFWTYSEAGCRLKREAEGSSMKQDTCPLLGVCTSLAIPKIFLLFVPLITASQWHGPFYYF